jgi:ubiquinone biosynthesis UbiH/UbiF/VisC/COQ6 family hydroxylase
LNDDASPDVLIVGAGPAGLALSVALAQAGIACTVLEQNTLDSLLQPAEDGRDIALTHRSRRILEQLGVWQRLPAAEIATLRQAQVRNGASPLVLPFDARADGHAALGWLVPNFRLREAACAAAQAAPGVRVIGDQRVTGIEHHAASITLRVAGGPPQQAPLVVAADSRYSSLRRLAGIGARMFDFGRTAIVCRVSHEHDHQGIAHECFRYDHTLAMLPMAGHQSSAVVTLRSDLAAEWLALSDEAYVRRVESHFDARLGPMRAAGPRHSYPLVAVYAHRFTGPRFALVGDAAVGMHPVTAHGYNFGLYGVEVLARELARARQQKRDLGAATALQACVLRMARQLPPLQALITRQLTGGPNEPGSR